MLRAKMLLGVAALPSDVNTTTVNTTTIRMRACTGGRQKRALGWAEGVLPPLDYPSGLVRVPSGMRF